MVFELAALYQATGIVGFLFFLFTAVTARGAHSGGGHHAHGFHGHHGGGHVGPTHGGGAHSIGPAGGAHARIGVQHAGGAPGAHGVGAQGGAHGGTVGAHGAAHGGTAPGAGHTGAPGTPGGHTGTPAGHGGNGNAHSGTSPEQVLVQGSTGQGVTSPMHVPHKAHRVSPVEIFLSVFNPMRMASFFLFFGATGRILQLTFPMMGYLTVPLALVAGVIGANLMLQMVSFIYSKFYSSSVLVVENLVGHMAEVTVSIPAGKTGEITYIVESKRFTSAAKAVDPAVPLMRGDRVMISNIENSLAYVEPWNDSFTDPEYDGESRNRNTGS